MPRSGRHFPAEALEEPPARPAVTMIMDVDDARAVALWLGHHRGNPAAGPVKDAMWLRAVLLKAEVGMSPYERSVLRARADRLLLGILG